VEGDHTKLSFSFEAHKAQTMERLRAALRNEQQVRSLIVSSRILGHYYSVQLSDCVSCQFHHWHLENSPYLKKKTMTQ